jgi:hypothetical protein
MDPDPHQNFTDLPTLSFRIRLLKKLKIQSRIFFTKSIGSSTGIFISASVLEMASRRGVRRFLLSTRFPSESNTACKITPEIVMVLKCIVADPGCLSPITGLDFSIPDPQH